MKLRINADDFGISPGVNSAVERMFKQQKLHSASLMYGCGYFDEAVKIAKQNPGLKIGLHFNLTTGKSAFITSGPSLLVDNNGNFKNGFLSLLVLSLLKRKQLLKEIRQELEAQIQAIIEAGIKLHHIDGHRHIHFIPGIFQIVADTAKAHQISQVRVINESLAATWSIDYPKTFLRNGGIIKWLILRILGLLNGSSKIPQPYFFSILYTCEISRELIAKLKIPKGFSSAEIMIHPADPKIDKQLPDLKERSHLLSKNRYQEWL